MPSFVLRTGGTQHPLAKGHDEAGLLRQRDELAGQKQAPLGVLPPYQGFRANCAPAVDFRLRLIVGHEFFTLQRLAQAILQGQSPKDAYFVKCDSTTTTQADIDRGIVNIIVGFAPLKPAEFAVLYIQQIAGQLAV